MKFLSFKGACLGSSESIHVKMPHCWKSHITAVCHFPIGILGQVCYLIVSISDLYTLTYLHMRKCSAAVYFSVIISLFVTVPMVGWDSSLVILRYLS